jgi:hypothetical protein
MSTAPEKVATLVLANVSGESGVGGGWSIVGLSAEVMMRV